MKTTPTQQLGSADLSKPDLFRQETLTTGTSEMFGQPTSSATINAISSPASADGRAPSVSPAKPMMSRGGLDRALANLSARQAKAAGLLTSGTYGRRSFISSASVALVASLVNRLRVRMASYGLILFTTTWKERTTPSGRPIYALRASAVRKPGNAYSGWPTPKTPTGGANSKRLERGAGGMDLQEAAQLAPWPAPTALSFNASHQPGNNRYTNKVCDLLSGLIPRGFIAATDLPGRLNPDHSRWLMGYPPAWSEAAPNWTDWRYVQRELIASAPREAMETQSLPNSELKSLEQRDE